jgi:hypothetical protein
MPLRKLRYVPGLISLVGLPILFFFCPIEDPPPEKVALQLSLPASSNDPETFTEQRVRSHVKKTNVTRVYLYNKDLSGHEMSKFQQDSKFSLIQREMERLSFAGDTTISLQVEFGPNNSYGEWVGILNMASLYGIRRYAFLDNSFYFLSNPPKETFVEPTGQLLEVEPVILDGEPISDWEWFLFDLSYKWKNFVYILRHNLNVVIPFVILIIFPSVLWMRQNRKRKLFVS